MGEGGEPRRWLITRRVGARPRERRKHGMDESGMCASRSKEVDAGPEIAQSFVQDTHGEAETGGGQQGTYEMGREEIDPGVGDGSVVRFRRGGTEGRYERRGEAEDPAAWVRVNPCGSFVARVWSLCGTKGGQQSLGSWAKSTQPSGWDAEGRRRGCGLASTQLQAATHNPPTNTHPQPWFHCYRRLGSSVAACRAKGAKVEGGP